MLILESLEQEFLLAMMRLQAGLIIDDLAFWFDVSNIAGKLSFHHLA